MEIVLRTLLVAFAFLMTIIVISLVVITRSVDTAQKPAGIIISVAPEEFTPYAKLPPSDAALRYRIKITGVRKNDEGNLLVPNSKLTQFRSPPGYMGAFSLVANARHQFAGRLYKVNSGAWLQVLDHGFLHSGGTLYDLGTLPGYQISEALAINNHGTVAGYSQEDSMNGGTPAHAVCWVGRKIRDLGIGRVLSINASGNMVGDSLSGQDEVPPLWTAHPEDYDAFRNDPHSHALLWTHGYRYDLNDCTPSGSSWVLMTATGITDKGRIVGYGLFHGKERAFLLTPR